MSAGYTAATAEAGTGSHRRRVALLEAHVGGHAPKMFTAATDGVVDQMKALARTIGKTLHKDVVEGAAAVRVMIRTRRAPPHHRPPSSPPAPSLSTCTAPAPLWCPNPPPVLRR